MVLVDTAGFGSRAMVVAIGGADAVLIPCQPDRSSVREAQPTANGVRTSRPRFGGNPIPNCLGGFRPSAATDPSPEAIRAELGYHDECGLSDRTAYQGLSWSGVMPTTGPRLARGGSLGRRAS